MLQRVVTILSGLALLGMGVGVVDAANIAQYGAVNTRPGGGSAQDVAMVNLFSAAHFIGLVLLIVASGFCIVLAIRRGLWLWAVALVVLTVGGLYASGDAGFNADVFSALLSLVAPLACLLFALTYQTRVRRGLQLT